MFEKILLAWGVFVLLLTIQAQAQPDPLATEIFTVPTDARRASSLDERIYLDPNADPLSIDPLMRPLHPEHTWEYLDKLYGRAYFPIYSQMQANVAGNWYLELRDSASRRLNLTLLQNRDAVFGRGIINFSGASLAAYQSGQIAKDVLYLDVIAEDLTLYRCTLTVVKDYLSGSYNAFDSLGRVWTGTVSGRRSA